MCGEENNAQISYLSPADLFYWENGYHRCNTGCDCLSCDESVPVAAMPSALPQIKPQRPAALNTCKLTKQHVDRVFRHRQINPTYTFTIIMRGNKSISPYDNSLLFPNKYCNEVLSALHVYGLVTGVQSMEDGVYWGRWRRKNIIHDINWKIWLCARGAKVPRGPWDQTKTEGQTGVEIGDQRDTSNMTRPPQPRYSLTMTDISGLHQVYFNP